MAEKTNLHIVMFPWPAFGHMIPFLELSKLIAKKGHRVSFVSTPRNIARLPKLPPPTPSEDGTTRSLIDFVELHLPRTDNLPETAEATVDLPYNKVKYLKLACDGLKNPFAQFLERSSPDCVLFDFNSYWVPSVASKLDIPSAYFSPFTASTVAFSGPSKALMGIDDDHEVEKRTKPEDFTVPPKWVPFETNVCFKQFEVSRTFDGITGDEENVSDSYRFGASMAGADFFAVRGCYEFEPEWLKVLEELHRKPVIPVGQLVTTGNHHDAEDLSNKDEAWRSIKEWLDEQEKGSVVYVAFGSEVKPSQTELNEIALGLELSGLPFLWVLSTKRCETDTEVVELPEGFEDRSKERGRRGIVCRSWAPQLKILSHESVGGYFTHCGWGSALEAIRCELPLILLPFLFDQGLNARVLEAKNMGYSVPRDDRDDGYFTGESVAESLRLVMIEEEGKIYREKNKEMKGLLCDEAAQDRYVDNLLDYVQNLKKEKGVRRVET